MGETIAGKVSETKANLSAETRDVLNECWKTRNEATGKLPETKDILIEVTCMKQKVECFSWAKEISVTENSETELLLVKVKKIKQKTKFEENWQESFTISMKVERDQVPREAEVLVNDIKMMKKWVPKICCKN